MDGARLPPRMRIEPTNFAGATFAHRMPRMVDEVLARSGWSADVRRRLQLLRDSLPSGRIPRELCVLDLDPELLRGTGLEEQPKTWPELPFFEAETVFHGALLGATEYDGESSRDPFFELKQEGLHSAEQAAITLYREVAEGFESAREELEALLFASLWGNVHDLSQFHAHGRSQTVLVDERPEAIDWIGKVASVDVILDNVGGELLSDFALCDALIGQGKRVRLHHKPRPFFVSDATRHDCLETIRFLAEHRQAALREAGTRLQGHLSTGALSLETDLFWCRPLHLTERSASLDLRLNQAGLVILKGDLNYRRVIEDRAYPFDSSPQDVVPTGLPPLLALRVLKSEVLVGLAHGQGERLSAKDPHWTTSGEYAVLQLFAEETKQFESASHTPRAP